MIGLERDILSLSSYGVCQIIFGRGGWFGRKNDKLLPFRILKEELRMRKVLSIVLVLALVLGSVAFTFGAVPSDVKGGKYEDAVNVLMELDVISGYPDGSYKPEGIVTRGEMAKIIICALGLDDYAAGASSFKDMAGHWSDKYVAYAVSLGIINGYPDGTFKPDNTVTYDEAAKMLVAALGYTEEALVGSWPVNWVTKAKTLGILDGITAGSAGANRGDIAIMTYQTLDQEIGKVNKDGDFVTALTSVGVSDTMLKRLGANEYDPGADAYDTLLASSIGAEFVVTGDEDSIISLKALQGALVTAYANDDNEIIAIKEVLSVFITDDYEDVDVDGVISTSDKFGDYKVKANFEIATAATAGTTYQIVNGGATAVAMDLAAVVDGDEYTIAAKVSGNYISKIYSIASWDATGTTGMIDEDDLEDIEDDELFGIEFKTNNKDEIDLDSFALFGVASLDDIKEDHVVYVYADATPEITRIDVGTEVVEGTVSKITSSGTKATVAGKEYKISGYVGGTFAGLGAKVGDSVELYLDYYGKVFDLEVTDGEDDLLAIVVDYELLVPVKMSDGDSQVKLFLADGTIKTFTVDDDDLENQDIADLFVVDPRNPDRAGGATGTLDAGQVVEYSLDKNGKLNAISFAAATGSDATGTMDVTKKGSYDGLYIASDATIFTTIDGKGFNAATEVVGNDEDEWGVTTLDKILGLEDVKAFYSYDATAKRIEWMVIAGGDTDEDVFAVYNDYAKVDADNEYEVYLMIDGKAVTYEATTVAKATAPGGTAIVGPPADTTVALYKIKLASDGTISSYTEITTVVGDWERRIELGGVITTNKVKSNVLTVTGVGDVALESDIVVYIWDDEWVKGTTGAFSKATDYTDIVFYDIDDNGLMDYALVK